MAAGGSVIKAGTLIHGKVQSATQARRAPGKSTLQLQLTQMVVNSKPVLINEYVGPLIKQSCTIPTAENQTATTNLEPTEKTS